MRWETVSLAEYCVNLKITAQARMNGQLHCYGECDMGFLLLQSLTAMETSQHLYIEMLSNDPTLQRTFAMHNNLTNEENDQHMVGLTANLACFIQGVSDKEGYFQCNDFCLVLGS